MSALIGKIDVLRPQQDFLLRLPLRTRLPGKPGKHLLLLHIGQLQLRQVRRTHVRCQGDARVFQRCDIQRLPNAPLLQKVPAEQFVRAAVIHDAPVAHQHHPVHAPVEHILQPMLNDDHGAAGALLNLVDQDNGLLPGGGVQIGQRLIEQQHIHIADHHAAQADPLLLAAGDLMGRVVQDPLHIHKLRDLLHLVVHFPGGNAVVFQGEGNVLRHRQADELAVRILKHRSHDLGKTKQPQILGVFPTYRQRSGDLTGVGVGHQAVDAVGKGGLTAAGGPGDQNFLALVNLQVDLIEGRLRLGGVLKTEVFKGNDRFFFQEKSS